MAALCFAMAYQILSLDKASSLNRKLGLGFVVAGLYELGGSVVVAAPDASWFGPALTLTSIAYLCLAPVVMASLFDFAGIRGRQLLLLLIPVVVLALVQLVEVLLGTWMVRGFHPTPWGNVVEFSSAPIPHAIKSVSSVIHVSFGLFALVYAWVHSRSKLYRTIALKVIVLSVLVNLWGIFSLSIVWRLWGLPDPSGIGATFLLIGYAQLIRKYEHLTERRPDMTGPLLASLKGTALFADHKGIVVKAPAEAVAFFGGEIENRPLLDLFGGQLELSQAWKTMLAEGQPQVDIVGLIHGGNFRIALFPHRNPFGDLDGALVRVIPESPMDEAILQFGLTAREQEVARMVCEGYERAQIAEALFISLSTVKNHLHNLYTKTNTTGQADLVRLFLSSGPAKIE